VFIAPFEVRLPNESQLLEKIDIVVQPDKCVVCDTNKLDEWGCLGAPALVVERAFNPIFFFSLSCSDRDNILNVKYAIKLYFIVIF
ncbi:MAG: hypothetical protein WDZ72_05385, partial [Cyclobacteriaceae bacterium]